MKEDQNKKEHSKEELKILEEMRANKEKQGTIESILYGLLQTAHPNMIQDVENQAVQMIKAGKILGQQLNEAEKDTQKKRWLEIGPKRRNLKYGFYLKLMLAMLKQN